MGKIAHKPKQVTHNTYRGNKNNSTCKCNNKKNNKANKK